MIFLLLMGPPGSGKGTQAKMLEDRLGLRHLSTGDLIRAEISQGTTRGKEFEQRINQGMLVEDSQIFDLLRNYLVKIDSRGVILDGFPRTTQQAHMLNDLAAELSASITGVFSLTIDDRAIVDRLGARLVCQSCGASFNKTTKPPRLDDICDLCGGPLGVRSDDRPETVLVRLQDYAKRRDDIASFYQNKHLWHDVDADRAPELVCDAICRIFKNNVGKGESKA